MVCGAKRIRSHYFPTVTGRSPELSTTTPLEGRACPTTINGAITPWRDAFAEQITLPLTIPLRLAEVAHPFLSVFPTSQALASLSPSLQ